MSALVSCKDAAFGYEGYAVISGLDFQVEHGDYICVVGENGAGKSTLIKGLLQLIKPMGGSLRLDMDKRDIGYLPQHSAAQKDFPASVREIVYTGLLNRRGLRPYYSKNEKQRAENVMRNLGIDHLQGSSFQRLSGGQQQRVLLARALCSAGKLLLLDEPVSGLDPMAAQEFYTLLNTLNQRDGLAILMVSHDVHSAVENSRHVLHLQHRQMFFGTAQEYCDSVYGRRFLGEAAHA